ncbi:integrase core domain-containing protein [Thalassolituus sp. UBA6592]
MHKYRTRSDLEAVLKESIEAYNTLRPHLSLGMKPPEEVHKKAS